MNWIYIFFCVEYKTFIKKWGFVIFVNKIVSQNLLKIKEHFYTYYTYFL